jgi:hypothetical protein
MKYLDALLRYFNENDYTHKEDVAIITSEIFEENPDISLEDFKKRIKKIRRDFFRINRLNRDHFAEAVYILLNKMRTERPEKPSKFTIAKGFIVKNFEVGFVESEHFEERKDILASFSSVSKPHTAAMKAFNQLLDKIQASYRIDLHGVKEYSGVDISKQLKEAVIGFQIKSRNDGISEHMVRSESSKAQEWKMDGFVLIYARKRDKEVESSIQAAYHHFKKLNESGKMYCAIIYPELLAELFRANSICLKQDAQSLRRNLRKDKT